MNNTPIIIERLYNAPVDMVWKALTDKAQMKQWYFDVDDFKPEVGFNFQFAGQGKEGEAYIHLCTVTEVVPQKKLTYSWKYQGYEGISYVSFDLTAVGHQTKVVLTHTGIETFPATANNAFAKENFEMGWNHITGISLKDFVEPKK
ncbi:MAG: SRPBCC domain-containing protein [Bacteroidetes bacterium]|nr:SRPBCC domain-containing protein [Bacteroidota bacterium]